LNGKIVNSKFISFFST